MSQVEDRAIGLAVDLCTPEEATIQRFVYRNSSHLRHRHGHVDMDSPCVRHVRALIDGEDVTRDCFAADDVEGWVDCFTKARVFTTGGELASHRRWGYVVIECSLHPLWPEVP